MFKLDDCDFLFTFYYHSERVLFHFRYHADVDPKYKSRVDVSLCLSPHTQMYFSASENCTLWAKAKNFAGVLGYFFHWISATIFVNIDCRVLNIQRSAISTKESCIILILTLHYVACSADRYYISRFYFYVVIFFLWKVCIKYMKSMHTRSLTYNLFRKCVAS